MITKERALNLKAGHLDSVGWVQIWRFFGHWFTEALWKGAETFKSGKEAVAYGVGVLSLIIGLVRYFNGKTTNPQFQPPTEVKEWVERIGFRVGAILLTRHFVLVPSELYKAAWKRSERVEAELKGELVLQGADGLIDNREDRPCPLLRWW